MLRGRPRGGKGSICPAPPTTPNCPSWIPTPLPTEPSRCNLPLDLKAFVYTALWQKLPVGTRQATWNPLATHCPLDGSLETMQHCLLHYRYLLVAYDTMVKCYPRWDKGVLGVQRLIDSDPATSLQTPVGILAWTAIHAPWKVRYVVKYHPEARDSFLLFLKRRLTVLRSLA